MTSNKDNLSNKKKQQEQPKLPEPKKIPTGIEKRGAQLPVERRKNG